jgi:splicing factor 3B subunit 1
MAAGAWDEAPSADGGATPSRWDAPTPGGGASRRNRWDETPDPSALAGGATPGGDRKVRSRWDETPVANSGGATPMGGGATPMFGGMMGATPVGGMDMQTPLPSQLAQMTPEQMNEFRHQRDVDERNRPWDDEELNALFPQEGYEILQPPAGYQPAMTPSRKLLATPTPGGTPQYSMPSDKPRDAYDVPQTPGDGALPFVKPEDYQVPSSPTPTHP